MRQQVSVPLWAVLIVVGGFLLGCLVGHLFPLGAFR